MLPEQPRAARWRTAVTSEYLELTSLIGPAGYVRDRLDAFRDAAQDAAQLKEWLA